VRRGGVFDTAGILAFDKPKGVDQPDQITNGLLDVKDLYLAAFPFWRASRDLDLGFPLCSV
jgi:hypothetical protein